jgi:hypothetical protein
MILRDALISRADTSVSQFMDSMIEVELISLIVR